MMLASTEAQDIRSQQTTSLALLGYAVFWRLSGVQIPHADLCQALAQAGFGHSIPPLPPPSMALRRALLQFAQRFWQEEMLVRMVSRTPCLLALVREEPDAQGTLTYQTRMRVQYDEGSQDIRCTRQAGGPIDATTEDVPLSTALRPLFQEACQTHTGEDLSRIVRAMMSSWQAVRLQRGVYFVPVQASAQLQRLDALVARLPGSPLLATLARMDERRTRERLVHAIHADLVRELETLETSLHDLQTARVPPTAALLCHQLVQFRTFQQKAQVYAELLGTRLQEMTARLETLQAGVQQLVLVDVNELLPA
jgi:hypothetical protein